MAIKTFYLLNTTATSPGWWGNLQEGGSAPAGALSVFGWTIAKVAVTTPYWFARLGATGRGAEAANTSWIANDTEPFAGSGSAGTTAGDSFVSPTAYTGTFASGNWTFNFGVRTGAASHAGRMRFQIWAGTNRNGTGARKIGTLQVCSTVTLAATATTYTSTLAYNPGAITLENEYLFFQLEWNHTTAGSSNSCTTQFWQSAGTIATTDFTAITVQPKAWNALEASTNFTLSNGDKTATSITVSSSAAITSTKQWTMGTAGKYYAEFKIDTKANQYVGLQNDTQPIATYGNGCMVDTSNGNIVVLGTGVSSVGAVATGDVICMAWDAGAKKVWFRKNNDYWDGNSSHDPATNVGGFSQTAASNVAHTLWCLNNGTGAVTSVRTELVDLQYKGPNGWFTWMGEILPIYEAWSSLDKSANVTLSSGDRTAALSTSANGGVHSSADHPIGGGVTTKYYAEFLINQTAQVQVGLHETGASLTAPGAAYVILSNGDIRLNGGTVSGSYLGVVGAGDVVCFALDAGAERVWFRRNNESWNGDAAANPATGTNGLDISASPNSAHSLWMLSATSGDSVTVRADVVNFTFFGPVGFTSWVGEALPVAPNIGTASGTGASNVVGAKIVGDDVTAAGVGGSSFKGAATVAATAASGGAGSSAVVGDVVAALGSRILISWAEVSGAPGRTVTSTGVAGGTGTGALVSVPVNRIAVSWVEIEGVEQTAAAAAAGAGVAAGTGATAFTGTAIKATTATAPATSVATATGNSFAAGTGTATGAGATTITGQAVAGRTVTAGGVGASNVINRSFYATIGLSSGIGAGGATGAYIFGVAVTAAGVGASAVIGGQLGVNVLIGSGLGSSAVVGASTAATNGVAAGVGASSVKGSDVRPTSSVAAGLGAGTATGFSFVARTVTTAGVGATSITGLAIFAGKASAVGAGASTVVGGQLGVNVFIGNGFGVAAAVGSSTAATTATGAGLGSATAPGTNVKPASATAAGLAAGTVIGRSFAAGAFSAAGTSTASVTGLSVLGRTVTAAGVGGSAVKGGQLGVNAGAAAGIGAATFVGTSTAASIAAASGVGAAPCTATAIKSVAVIATGAGTATATGRAIVAGIAAASGLGTAIGIAPLNAVNLVAPLPVFEYPAVSIPALLRLGDRVLDYGLRTLDIEADKIFICNNFPVTYLEATSTYAIGSKHFGQGLVFGAPAAGVPKGRIVTSIAVSDGLATTIGTPQCWAVVDSMNSRLLATGPASGFTTVGVNWSWTLEQIPIHMDG